jgi:hypothetical protein
MFTGISMNAQTQNMLSVTNSVSDEINNCKNLENFLSAEFSNSTKVLKNAPNVRLYGVQEKDAMAKALSLCIRLNAKRVDSGADGFTFKLPEDLGTIVISEIYSDGVYVKVLFLTVCKLLPFTEIRYVGIKLYNNQ